MPLLRFYLLIEKNRFQKTNIMYYMNLCLSACSMLMLNILADKDKLCPYRLNKLRNT